MTRKYPHPRDITPIERTKVALEIIRLRNAGEYTHDDRSVLNLLESFNTEIPCKLCRRPTRYLGSCECESCHQLYAGMANLKRNPTQARAWLEARLAELPPAETKSLPAIASKIAAAIQVQVAEMRDHSMNHAAPQEGEPCLDCESTEEDQQGAINWIVANQIERGILFPGVQIKLCDVGEGLEALLVSFLKINH